MNNLINFNFNKFQYWGINPKRSSKMQIILTDYS